MIAGFDFGTTNSLVSVVVGDRIIDVLDDEGRPHPSVVRYEGETVTVGREARDALDEAGLGVFGSTVRSPKFLLGDESVSVGGVERNPTDIVADVVRHVRRESLRSPHRRALGDLDRAVVTIPVTMDGRRRADLREAFAQAEMSVAQFIHEPLAALYGYLRGHEDPDNAARGLMGRYVLVVDWGGGTLDLTLCRVTPGQIQQLRNGGSDTVGGDQFDKVLRDEIVKRFSRQNDLAGTDLPRPETRLRLLQDTERNKIDMSTRERVTFYRPDYFQESGTTLEYRLGRDELDEITKPLVDAGIGEIAALLDSVGIAPMQVSLCLVAGGMAAMPSIRGRLYDLFGTERVVVPDNSATLVSQGAAWVAHDRQRLTLAKTIELELARGSRLPLLPAGTSTPGDGEVQRDTFHLFCTDPTDGKAKFSIVCPTDLTAHAQASDPRTHLGMVTIAVDETAPPLVERLELTASIDDDLILTIDARSSRKHHTASASYFDLEFGIGLPGSGELGPAALTDDRPALQIGGLVVRANIADRANAAQIPGDVLHRFRPTAFQRLPGPNQATEQQIVEHLYHQPCGRCRRRWGDPSCRCASLT